MAGKAIGHLNLVGGHRLLQRLPGGLPFLQALLLLHRRIVLHQYRCGIAQGLVHGLFGRYAPLLHALIATEHPGRQPPMHLGVLYDHVQRHEHRHPLSLAVGLAHVGAGLF